MNEKVRRGSAEPIFKAFVYVVLITLAILIIVPVAWVFLASIKQNSEFYGNPWALPAGFYWQNFVDAWNSASMGSYMMNSILVTVLSLVYIPPSILRLWAAILKDTGSPSCLSPQRIFPVSVPRVDIYLPVREPSPGSHGLSWRVSPGFPLF